MLKFTLWKHHPSQRAQSIGIKRLLVTWVKTFTHYNNWETSHFHSYGLNDCLDDITLHGKLSSFSCNFDSPEKSENFSMFFEWWSTQKIQSPTVSKN